MANGLHFYRRTQGKGFGSALIEEVEIGDISTDDRGAVTIAIARPTTFSPAMLVAEIEYNGRPLGRLQLNDWLITIPPKPWLWFVDAAEISRIEDVRGGNDLGLLLRGTGIGELSVADRPPELSAIQFASHFTVPHSTWERILTQLKYSPMIALSLPKSLAHWPEWGQAFLESESAVRALSRGETHSALQRSLGLLEKLRPAPYSQDSWVGVFDIDKSKEDGLKALIAGVAMYLNKVGHHRSRTERDTSGDLAQSPVDHYEAEILVSFTQLLLAYLKRLPKKSVDATTKK